jgi:hypothetical protein
VRDLSRLAALNKLTTLHLHDAWEERMPAATVVSGLQCCPQLTALSLSHAQLSSGQLTAALTSLRALLSLKMDCYMLTSIAALACVPRLENLEINDCPYLPSSDLQYVLQLHCLTKLAIYSSFAKKLTQQQRLAVTPNSPSLLIPSLRECFLFG